MEHVNEIVLVGRLSGEPKWRELRNGAQIAVWRIVVPRRQVENRANVVDTIQCMTFDESVKDAIGNCETGDGIEVRGALRRRFWQTATGPANRYEVEVAGMAVVESQKS